MTRLLLILVECSNRSHMRAHEKPRSVSCSYRARIAIVIGPLEARVGVRPRICLMGCFAVGLGSGFPPCVGPGSIFTPPTCVRALQVPSSRRRRHICTAFARRFPGERNRGVVLRRSGGTPETRLRQRFFQQFRPTYAYTHTRQKNCHSGSLVLSCDTATRV